MTAHDINIVLQISCVTVLGVVCILLIKHARAGLNTWAGIGFTASVICYLALETYLVKSNPTLYYIALTGSISVPVFFFLLTKAIFDDHFKPSIANPTLVCSRDHPAFLYLPKRIDFRQ